MIDLSRLGSTVASASIAPLVGAALAWGVNMALVGLRLREATRAAGGASSVGDAVAITLSAALADLTTFGAAAAEAARLGWLRRRLGVPTSRAITALAVDRIADAIAILAVVACGVSALPQLAHSALWAILPLLLLAPLVFVLRRWLATSPRRVLVAGATLSPLAIAGWLFTLVRMLCVAHAVHLGLDARMACALAVAGLAGGQAPTPGGIGAVEVALLATGALLHLPALHLAAFVIVDRGLIFVIAALSGVVSSLTLIRPARRSFS